MESHLFNDHYDLVTPDGIITHIEKQPPREALATVFIQNISPAFKGFVIDKNLVFFNIKSTLAQLSIDGHGIDYNIDSKALCAEITVKLHAIDSIGEALLKYIEVGALIGRLFAADDRRCVRDPEYLYRMFGRSDRWGRPLLSLGGMQGSADLILDKVDGRTVAYLSLQNGKVSYSSDIQGFLPTVGKGLKLDVSLRNLLKLNQEWHPHVPRNVDENELLLVRTMPLHIRTVFARVVDKELTKGYQHTTASILQPDTTASGDIYELYGNSKREVTDIPLEFYTLEPYREHVFFEDRDQLQNCLINDDSVFEAFKTAPEPTENPVAVFIVKGDQLKNLKPEDWIVRKPLKHEFPGLFHPVRQALMVERYIEQQPEFSFLKSIEDGFITSQGVLFVRYFPTPLMKRMLLSTQVQNLLKRIYFLHPSSTHGSFFSHEDRAMLNDLAKFGIPVYWVDEATGKVLRYVQRGDQDSGMFVPESQTDNFLRSTVFGIYGSNLLRGDFEDEIYKLLQGVLKMKDELKHPMLNPTTPLALVTGGGPGAMEVGNRVAKNLNILSCGRIVDFRAKEGSFVNEQLQNPHVEAKMTYRLDKLVERQAEFNLDFPIFVIGGIGTDFEFSLELVRRKIGSTPPRPIILFGSPDYWKQKITSIYHCNLESGTIKGSEWIGNCCFCIESAQDGLKVYHGYFSGKLVLGKDGPVYPNGFVTMDDLEKLLPK